MSTVLENVRRHKTDLEKLLSTIQLAVRKCRERPKIEGGGPAGLPGGIGRLPVGLLARPRGGG